MRYIAAPVPLLSFLFLLLAARSSSAFSLPAAAGAIMTGASPPSQAAASTATTPGATLGLAAAAAGRATEEGGVSSRLPSHLVVLAHGLGGTADDLSYLKESLERSGGAGILVHSARCNEGKTKDGVVKGGMRLAEEILELVSSTPSLSRISLVGNSLGGLYMRYAAKLLYRDGDTRATGTGATVAGLQPSVFLTIASPHLGVRRFTYVPLPSILHPLAEVLFGKTGADLFLSRRSVAADDSTGDGVGGDAARRRSSTPSSRSPSPPLDSSPSDTGDSDTGQGKPAGIRATDLDGGGGGGGGGAGGQEGGGSAAGVGRGAPLLYNMATSEEFLRPLRAFRWRRAYANRRGDFMVPYGTAAFVEPDEKDGSEALGGEGGGFSVPPGADEGAGTSTGAAAAAAAASPTVAEPGVIVGTGSFTLVELLLGAKSGAIVGFSVVPPAGTATSEEGGESVKVSHGTRISARLGGPPTGRARSAGEIVEDERSMEEEMASGLNSCGWEKVSVDFGCLAPVSHNKICALSRTPLARALYGSGKSIVDHAADFLVVHGREGVEDGGSGDADP